MCVNIATGEVSLAATDFAFASKLPVALERSYVSTALDRSDLGHGWSHNLLHTLRVVGAQAHYRTPDGSEMSFALPPGGGETWVGKGSLAAHRLDLGAKGATIATPDRRLLVFEHPSSNRTVWPLARIVDLNGNAVTFAYDERNLLRQITDCDGRRFRLRYTDAELLVEVTLAPADGRSIPLVHYDYDANGDLVAVTDALGHTARYEYAEHLIVRAVNRLGASCFYEYDAAGRCLRTWYDGGYQHRRLDFDSEKRTTVLTDALGHRTLYRFNNANMLVEKVDCLGQSQKNFYDPHGNLLTSENPQLGDGGLFHYDPEARTVTHTTAGGTVTQFAFNELNQLTSFADADGNVHSWQYDQRGNLLSCQTPGGSRWTYAYDPRGYRTRITDPTGYEVHVRREGNGSSVVMEDVFGILVRMEYDLFGNLTGLVDGDGRKTVTEYDRLRHVTLVQHPDGTAETLTYDAEGNPVSQADALGLRFQWAYDGFGNLLQQTDAIGQVFRLEYDLEGRQTTAINEEGDPSRFDYDPLGRMIGVTFFDGQTQSFEYSPAGNLLAIVDGAGYRTRLEFDDTRRLTSKTYADGSQTVFGYDALGRMIEATSPTSSLLAEYDVDGRVVKEIQGDVAIAYQYDARGRTVQVDVDDGYRLSYAYDPRGRLIGLKDPQGGDYSIQYSPADLTQRIQTPTGLTQVIGYDARGKVVRHVVVRPDGQESFHREYKYDRGGRLSSVWDAVQQRGVSCRHDALDRLTGVEFEAATAESYRYDSAGNLVAAHDCRSTQIAPGNRLRRAGEIELEYDARGNVVKRKSPAGDTHFEYNFENELVRCVGPDNKVVEFQYDALKRRLKKIANGNETRYAWDADALVRVESDGEDRIDYCYLPKGLLPLNQLQGDARYEMVLDHLGSPVELLDGSGEAAWRAPWRSFGMGHSESQAASCILRFPGQFFDEETQLSYNRSRYYDPALRRYISQDAARFRGGTNFYAYVKNSPLNLIDPRGFACFRAECDKLAKDMNNMVNQSDEANPPSPGGAVPSHGKGLRQRAAELVENTMNLPYERLPGDPKGLSPTGGGNGQRMTIRSHFEQYWMIQQGVQNRLAQWDALGCKPANTSDPTSAGKAVKDAREWQHADPPIPETMGDPAAMWNLP